MEINEKLVLAQPTLREIQRIVTFDDLRNQHAAVGYTIRKLDGLAEELIKDPENGQLVDHYDRLVEELGNREAVAELGRRSSTTSRVKEDESRRRRQSEVVVIT